MDTEDGGKFKCTYRLITLILTQYVYIYIYILLCSGNDVSYDEQVPPAVPQAVSKVLEENNLSDNYNTPNWGGSGGDWCRYKGDPTRQMSIISKLMLVFTLF